MLVWIKFERTTFKHINFSSNVLTISYFKYSNFEIKNKWRYFLKQMNDILYNLANINLKINDVAEINEWKIRIITRKCSGGDATSATTINW